MREGEDMERERRMERETGRGRMPGGDEERRRETGRGRALGGDEERRRETVVMKMDSRSENEEFARVVAAVFASRLDPTLEELDDIKTAVSEAVTNAIIHGYQGGEGIVELNLTAEENVLTVTVQDAGVGIPDVEKAMEPMYTTAPEGERSGMGFSFMEAFMDQVEVISAPGKGTTVIMRKKIGR